MSKPSKKRSRTAEEDVAEAHDAKPAVKKSKLDSTGKAEVTKKSSKVKEPKSEPVAEEAPSKKEKKEKKDKKDKKDKKRKSKDAEVLPDADDDSAPAPAAPSSTELKATKSDEAQNGEASASSKTKKKERKEKKDKKDKKSKLKTATTTEDETEQQPQQQEGEDEPSEEQTTSSGKPARFIVFVGNLPFSATADDVRAHFATLHPTSVRLLTQRDDPRKSRGIAFVEFGRYDHMKTCLEKFHHTEFGEGKEVRRINVELTAGGGGKTAHRQDKIKQKNAKLNEERAQRIKKEGEAKQAKSQEERDEEAIHPSRRARVPYGKK